MPLRSSLPRILLSTLLAMVSLAGADGLPQARMAFRRYGVMEGLRNLAVWCSVQDRHGFLWFGTEGGVFRYDGSRFTPFPSPPEMRLGEIYALHEDPSGTLWVGGYGGLARFDGGKFTATNLALPVEHIASGPEGRIWCTTPKGPFRQVAEGKLEPVPDWPGGEATALWASPDRATLWVTLSRPASGAPETRLLSWQASRWRTSEGALPFRDERIDCLMGDPQGRLWARSSQNLWVSPRPGAPFSRANTPQSPVNAHGMLAQDRHGRLWVPTSQALMVLDGQEWQVLDPRIGYPIEGVRSVLDDREGNLWITGDGVSRRLGRGFLSSFTRAEGLPSNVIWRIFRDSQGTLWVATDKGACRVRNGRWEPFTPTGSAMVRAFAEDGAGRLYFAGSPQLLLRCRLDGSGLERIPVVTDRPTKRIFQVVIDSKGQLWMATENAGLLTLDTKAARPTFQAVPLPGGTPDERISDITLDALGRLWVCGTQGLAVLEGGQWRRYTDKDGLQLTHVTYVRPIRGGDILVAYFGAGGLSRFHIGKQGLENSRHLSTQTGLASDSVYFLGEDVLGGIWIGGGAGVDRILDESIEHFGATEGLPSDDCNAQAFLSEPNGDVWLGTSGGLARLQLRNHPGPPTPPPAVLLSVKAGNQFLPLHPQAPLQLPYQRNTLEFAFAGLSFAGENLLEYQVRLVGLENDWRTSSSHEARYPALPKGTYKFEMRTRVGKGAWSEPAVYPFQVSAPWWQTPWFLTLSLIAGAAGLLALIRLRIAHLQRHNQELESLVNSRTQELKEANEALRNQSITDPLTGLRNRRYLGTSLPADIAQVNRVHRSLKMGLSDRISANVDMLFLMVDLDHFKTVNDEYGHHAGDLVLQQVAELLRLATRDSDTVVRWGGEEFLVVCRNACRRESMVVAERVRSMVANHPFDLGEGRSAHRSCSVGYAFYPLTLGVPELFTWEQVLDLADQCLFAAKRAGRNAYVGIGMTDEDRLLPFHRAGFVPMERLVEDGAVVVEHSPSIGDNLDWRFDKH